MMTSASKETAKSGPSRWSHLYRLGLVLVAFFVFAGAAGWWATPASWNYEWDNWYRGDTLIDAAAQPLVYGGNESCRDCHAAAGKLLRKYKHRGLACESCHGALADHVQAGSRVAAAKVDKSRWQCDNCHAEQINRPESLPQFSKEGEIGKYVKKHAKLDDVMPCLECHDAHDPTR